MFWLAFSWMKSRGEIYTSFRIICSPFHRDRLYCTQPPLPPDSNKVIDAKDKKVKIGTIWISRVGADWFCKWIVRNTTYLTSWAFSRTSSLPVLYSSLLKSFMLSMLFRCSFQILLERNGVLRWRERCCNQMLQSCHFVPCVFFLGKMPHSVSKVPRLSQPSRRLPKEWSFIVFGNWFIGSLVW